MVRSSLVTLNFFIEILLAIGHISAMPNQRDSLLKQLTDTAEEKVLVLIVGFPSESESNIRSGPKLKSDHAMEEKEKFQASKLLNLLLKSKSNIRSGPKLESDHAKAERENFQAAELLNLLLKSKPNIRSGRELESDHTKEKKENFQAAELLNLLLKSKSNIRSEGKILESDYGKKERKNIQAAKMLRLLLKSKSNIRSGPKLESGILKKDRKNAQAAKLLRLLLKPKRLLRLSDASIELNLRSAALRSDCQKTLNCVKKCMKKSCKDTCKAVYDAYDQCGTTTTRKPKCVPKRGRTMPPKWKNDDIYCPTPKKKQC